MTRDNAAAQRSAGIFVPILLTSLAVVGGLALQTVQLARDQRQLAALNVGQQPQHQAAKTIRASLDSLATATAKLAADGNSSALSVVDELRKRGVTITPSGAAKAE